MTADLFSWLRALLFSWLRGGDVDPHDGSSRPSIDVLIRLWPLALDVIEAAKLQGEAEPPDLGEADEALAHAVAAFLAAAEKEMGS